MSTPKILIRTPNWLGDLMMSTAFVKEVLTRFADSPVDLVVKKGFEILPLPHRGKIHAFDKHAESAYQFGKRLRVEQYDYCYVLPPSFSSALMAFASKATYRYGYTGNLRSLMLNRSKRYTAKHRSQHLVSEYLQLLEDWETTSRAEPGLTIDSIWIEKVLANSSLDLPQKYICLAPGVIYGPAKQWPISYFKTLVEKLNKQRVSVVIIGTESDRSLGDLLTSSSRDVQNLCGKTSLNQLIAVLALSCALVSNDSGTMHIMAALQKPQIAIFGSTSTVWTGPVNRHAEIVKIEIDCSPCFKRECPLGHTNCLQQITPEMVWKKLEPMLSA